MNNNDGWGYLNIISSIINACKFTSFVEIGVYKCINFNKVFLENPQLSILYGVDIDKTCLENFPRNDKCIFFNDSSDNFFKSIQGKKFDCFFIDGCHTFEQSLNDFKNSIDNINDDGIIFMHDTYPPSLYYHSDQQCGKVYKTYLEIQNNYSNVCEIVNIPIKFGLSIIRKRNISQPLLTI